MKAPLTTVIAAACSLLASHALADCTTNQVLSAAAETATINFNNLNNGQGLSVTVAGRSLTCTATTNATAVRTFFVAGTVPANCTAAGTLTGWTAAAGANSSTAVFTSTTLGNVSNISTAGNLGTVTTVDGTSGLQGLLTGSLVCGRPVAGGYTGDLADRWQEQHRTGGQLFDFKRGVGHPMDPEKLVGSYSFGGTGTSSVVTHTYGSSSFSWRVFLQAAPNTYSFCNAAGQEVVRAIVTANAGISGSGCATFP